MRDSRRWTSRFDDAEGDDLFGPFGNFIDVMLVFACGLIAALTTSGLSPTEARQSGTGRRIERGKELPEVPRGVGRGRGGFESVGVVYRDPKTGKLILVGHDGEPSGEAPR